MKNPGEVRARTCGTKSPSRSEALRFIESTKSPSTWRFKAFVLNLLSMYYTVVPWPILLLSHFVFPPYLSIDCSCTASQLTICKSQRHFVSAAAAILKEVSLGPNLTQSRCGCTVVCQSFGRTATFCKNWEIVDSLSCDTWLSLSIAKVQNKRK